MTTALYYQKNKEKVKAHRRAYYKAHREEQKEYTRDYYKNNKEKVKEDARDYYKRHKRKYKTNNANWMSNNKEYRAEYNRLHSERKSVMAHYKWIFKSEKDSTYHRSYAKMPFYDAWNPDKEGSFDAAETWIIETLGRRPKNCSLHIVDHAIGFMPGNLEWTYPKRQINQQMFKIIAQQRNKIKKLEDRIKELENR